MSKDPERNDDNSIGAALKAATQELARAQIADAAGDARRLVAFAMELSAAALSANLGDRVTPAGLEALDAAIRARIERRPVSHIVGGREFWGHRFKVTPAVLDPRPETEILVEAALSQPFSRVLDLGTGSGCILLSLLADRPQASGVGVDASPDALEVALENAAGLDLEGRADFLLSDWFSAFDGVFDLIVANPPYIALEEMATLQPEVLKWEPMAALCAGPSGLEAYETIAEGIGPYLAPGGRVLLEVGPTQADAVSALFAKAGLVAQTIHPDLDGRARVVEMRAPKKG